MSLMRFYPSGTHAIHKESKIRWIIGSVIIVTNNNKYVSFSPPAFAQFSDKKQNIHRRGFCTQTYTDRLFVSDY